MKEQLVEFETAKLAKEVGFNEFCYSLYQDEQCLLKDCFEYNPSFKYYNSEYKSSSDNPEWFLANACSAPTQSLLQKWLREIHGIEVFTKSEYKDTKKIGFYYGGDLEYSKPTYKTYEEALEKGLIEALKLIKNE
jgi:hypothetical protein